jgi:hypothetical protein
MAWNPYPKVADCREIARKWGGKQIIVILAWDLDADTVETVSYGQTKVLCAAAKHFGEAAYNGALKAFEKINQERKTP